jgi:putative ABC transport system permease protein
MGHFRQIIRVLLKRPEFTITFMMAFVIAIGPNVILYSIIKAVIFDPIPFPDSGRLVSIVCAKASQAGSMAVSYQDFDSYRAEAKSYFRLAAYRIYPMTLTDGGYAERIMGLAATANLPRTLGIVPELGRDFVDDDDQLKGPPYPVLISHRLWVRRFAADTGIIGRIVQLNNRPFTVAGVLPETCRFPLQADPADFWTTRSVDLSTALVRQRGARVLEVIGRLNHTTTVGAAAVGLGIVAGRLSNAYPSTNAGVTVRVRPLIEQLTQSTAPVLWLVLTATASVLVIAVGNIANLLIAHLSEREGEMAIRYALGATRRDIWGQLLSEYFLASAITVTVSLALASAGLRAVRLLVPTYVPGLDNAHIDIGTVVASCALAGGVVAAVVIGIVRRLGFLDRGSGEKVTLSTHTGSLRRLRLRSSLAIAQLALSLGVLTIAVTAGKGLVRLLSKPPGFVPDHVLTLKVSLPRARYSKGRDIAFFDSLIDDFRHMPGVSGAAGVTPLPLSAERLVVGVDILGRGAQTAADTAPDSSVLRQIGSNIVTVYGDYFRTMGIPLREGREFSSRDVSGPLCVVVVDSKFARKAFGSASAIGMHIRPGISGDEKVPVREIVGVVGDVEGPASEGADQPTVYIPLTQLPTTSMAFVVRTAGSDGVLGRPIQQTVSRRDAQVPVYDMRGMSNYMSLAFAQPRFVTFVFGGFGALALLLALVGMYGMTAEDVQQRRRELSVRVALGADERLVLWSVIRRNGVLVLMGVPLGAAIAYLLGKLLSGVMAEVPPLDGGMIAVVTVVLISFGAVCSYLAARGVVNSKILAHLRQD